MEINQLVQNFGLPVGLLLYFIWQNYRISQDYNSYIKDIAQKAVDAINKSTDADTRMLGIADRLEKRLDDGRSI